MFIRFYCFLKVFTNALHFQERQVKYEFIQQNKYKFPVEKMCKIFVVSKSGYYEWTRREPSAREIRNQILIEKINQIYYNELI